MATIRSGQSKHILSELLSAKEKSILEGWLGSDTLVTASGVCQLLVDNGTRQWRLVATGVVCLTKDKRRRIYCIQFFDGAGQLLMEQRLYKKFLTYSSPAVEKLLQFEGDHYVHGLNFADVNEARFFKNSIHDWEISRERRASAPSFKPPPSDLFYQPLSINNTLKSIKKKNKKLNRSDIGLPSNFCHLSHFDIHPDKSFVKAGAKAEPKLDPRICSLLKTIGEPIDQLTNDEQEFIQDFIEKQGGVGNVERELTTGAPAYVIQPFSQIVPAPTLNRPNQATRPKIICPPPPPPPPNSLAPRAVPCQPTTPPPPPPMPPPSFGSTPNSDQGRTQEPMPGDLMSEILLGKQLRPVGASGNASKSPCASPRPEHGGGGAGIAEALAKALADRRGRMKLDEEVSGNEEEGETNSDDAEWD